jgi:hypothetical protein
MEVTTLDTLNALKTAHSLFGEHISHTTVKIMIDNLQASDFEFARGYCVLVASNTLYYLNNLRNCRDVRKKECIQILKTFIGNYHGTI